MSPATTAAAPAKSSVRSSFSTDGDVVFGGRKAMRSPTLLQCATTNPASPPPSARSTLSVNSCERSLARLTPNARRTAISRRRRNARAKSRFATFAQAISSTTIATPPSHAATFAKPEAFGPRSLRIEPIIARGRSSASGGIRDDSTRSASVLFTNAWVRSALAAASLTPGFRRAIMSIQPQWYVVHQVASFTMNPARTWASPKVLIGMKYAGCWFGQSPTNPGAATPMTW